MSEVNIIPFSTVYTFNYSQSAQEVGTASSQSLAYSSSVNAGDLLIACINSDGQNVTGVSDSQGNAWSAVPGTPIETDSTPRYAAMYWAVAGSSAANTVTVTFNAAGPGSVVMIAAYTPDGGVPSLDAYGVSTGISVTSLTATTGSATYSNDLLVLFCASFDNDGSPSGYTVRQDQGPNSTTLFDSVATSSGVQSVTETFGSSTAALILVAFTFVKPGKFIFSIS